MMMTMAVIGRNKERKQTSSTHPLCMLEQSETCCARLANTVNADENTITMSCYLADRARTPTLLTSNSARHNV